MSPNDENTCDKIKIKYSKNSLKKKKLKLKKKRKNQGVATPLDKWGSESLPLDKSGPPFHPTLAQSQSQSSFSSYFSDIKASLKQQQQQRPTNPSKPLNPSLSLSLPKSIPTKKTTRISLSFASDPLCLPRPNPTLRLQPCPPYHQSTSKLPQISKWLNYDKELDIGGRRA
jgi:hypothetical protein